jgi:RsiW-degrading membrane proteinase PrsW (M82 family)
MLTLLAFGKSVAMPIVMAALLVAFARHSANLGCVLASFLAGILGAYSLNNSILRTLPAFTPTGQLQVTTVHHAWLSGFLEAALPEELSKGLWILVLLLGWRRYSSGHGALIGGLIGMGFALRENLSNALVAPEWRATPVLLHGAWGIIMGHLFSKLPQVHAGASKGSCGASFRQCCSTAWQTPRHFKQTLRTAMDLHHGRQFHESGFSHQGGQRLAMVVQFEGVVL